jgi:hypothetical protein
MMDEKLFKEHLMLPEYLFGESQGMWGQVQISDLDGEMGPKWPHSLFWISVPPLGKRGFDKYYVMVELSNYNVDAPSGCFWDIEKNCRLNNSLWPKVTGPLSQGFRIDWQNLFEFYAPWDRGGRAHPEWAQANKAVSWKSGESKIHDYLGIIYDILNSENYHGTRED